MKKISLLFYFCAICIFSNAQSLNFVLPLDGSIGDLSVPANVTKATNAGWVFGGPSFLANTLFILEPDAPLTFADSKGISYPVDGTNTIYQEYPYYTGTGASATSTGTVAGSLAAYPFSSAPISSGAVYMTFMFQSFNQVASGQRSPGSNVQMIAMTGNLTTPSAGATSGSGVRLWMRKNTSDDPNGLTTYHLSITRSAGNVSSASPSALANIDFQFDQTYLLVMKYDFDTQTASLFVNPDLNSAIEPTPDATDNSSVNGADPLLTEAVQYVQVRQNGNNLAYYYIGGLRVTDSWSSAVATGINMIKGNDTQLTVVGMIITATVPGTLTIYSLQGATVFQSVIDKTVDTNLPEGIYLAKLVTANEEQVNQKIMIK